VSSDGRTKTQDDVEVGSERAEAAQTQRRTNVNGDQKDPEKEEKEGRAGAMWLGIRRSPAVPAPNS
jgi:hypothetical protein